MSDIPVEDSMTQRGIQPTARTRRVSRRWAAIVLLATWSLGGIWSVAHAAEHWLHHGEAHQEAPIYGGAGEVSLTLIGHAHGHSHPSEEAVLSATNPRLEPFAGFLTPALDLYPAVTLSSRLPEHEAPSRAEPCIAGAFGPRAPPLS